VSVPAFVEFPFPLFSLSALNRTNGWQDAAFRAIAEHKASVLSDAYFKFCL